MQACMEIAGLTVALRAAEAAVPVVNGLDLRIGRGETVCLVGESGSGKTMAALAMMRLVEQKGAWIAEGRIHFGGRDLAALSQREMSQVRGARIGMIFQEPMTAFDPLFTIGEQIAEVILRHGAARDARRARERALALLEHVRIPAPALRLDQYPHQLSGGMRQRAMIAMALACEPDLLIADEPTTALDVTIQAQILALLRGLQRESGMAILLITHDLGIAAEMADRIAVMYAGNIVEAGTTQALFSRPRHPYTQGLLGAIVGADTPRGQPLRTIPGAIPSLAQPLPGCRFHPRCAHADGKCRAEAPPRVAAQEPQAVSCWHAERIAWQPLRQAAVPAGPQRPPQAPLLEVMGLSKHFPVRRGLFGKPSVVRAVDDVSFGIARGETFGLVGESGCGKSTLARVLMQLDAPTEGDIRFEGVSLTGPATPARKAVRRDMQMVFQDPHGSLNSRWTVGDIVGEPLRVHARLDAAERRARVEGILELVGIDPSWYGRYPHAFSGGQRQRLGIARAIILNPKLVVADEAVSALDVSVQGQVINLLQELRQTLDLTYLFIGHGLHVVRYVADRIGVMYLGQLVETGPTDSVFRHPAHPYTKALIDAIPQVDPGMRYRPPPVAGEVPSPANPPPGCRFHTRCPAATERCRSEAPGLARLGGGRAVACHFPL